MIYYVSKVKYLCAYKIKMYILSVSIFFDAVHAQLTIERFGIYALLGSE
jgi:hypothetical protein